MQIPKRLILSSWLVLQIAVIFLASGTWSHAEDLPLIVRRADGFGTADLSGKVTVDDAQTTMSLSVSLDGETIKGSNGQFEELTIADDRVNINLHETDQTWCDRMWRISVDGARFLLTTLTDGVLPVESIFFEAERDCGTVDQVTIYAPLEVSGDLTENDDEVWNAGDFDPDGATANYVLASDGTDFFWKVDEGGGSGTSDHGALTGLADDDHTQYYNATRLAAWTGSANVATVGTITAGVWQGTAIDETYIDADVARDAELHDAATLAADADAILGLSTQELSLDTQTANTVWAGPTSGAAADPTFRALVEADVPSAFLTQTEGDARYLQSYSETDPDFAAMDTEAELEAQITDVTSFWNDGDFDPNGETANYVLATNGTTFVWKEDATGDGASDHGALTGLGDDDHPQYLLHTEADTEAELEALLTDVANVFTNNDGALDDDDLSDNDTDDLAEGTNMYYTDARARSAISETVDGLTYDSGSGVFNEAYGYAIPQQSDINNWNTAYGWGDPSGTYLPLAGGNMTGILQMGGSTFVNTTRDVWADDAQFTGGVEIDNGAAHAFLTFDKDSTSYYSQIAFQTNNYNRWVFKHDTTENFILWRYNGLWNNDLTIDYTTGEFQFGNDVDVDAVLTVGDSATIDGNEVWHAGNDGTGSGLDADLLDGLEASVFLQETDIDTEAELEAVLTDTTNVWTSNDTIPAVNLTEADPVWTAAEPNYGNLTQSESVTGSWTFDGLDVYSSGSGNAAILESDQTTTWLWLVDSTNEADYNNLGLGSSSGNLIIRNNDHTVAYIKSNDDVIWNYTQSSGDFTVRGSSTYFLLQCDTGANSVGVFDSTPDYTLDVGGDIGLDGDQYFTDTEAVIYASDNLTIDVDDFTLTDSVLGDTFVLSATGDMIFTPHYASSALNDYLTVDTSGADWIAGIDKRSTEYGFVGTSTAHSFEILVNSTLGLLVATGNVQCPDDLTVVDEAEVGSLECNGNATFEAAVDFSGTSVSFSNGCDFILPCFSSAPSSPVAGQVYFNTSNSSPWVYDGSTWYQMN